MEKMEELQIDRALLQKRRNLPCVLCEKSFSHKYYLNNHMKLEHEDNPENGICDQCDKNFKNRHQLAQHRYRRHVTKKMTIKCDNCERMFSNQSSKDTHNKRIHLMEKNVSCPECYYRGFDEGDLKYHMMNKHSNERPHKCTLCPMAFKRVSGLYQHSKTHSRSDAKDYPCNICGNMFRLKSSADRCLAKHTEEGSFQCSVEHCEAVFDNKFSYRSHVRRVHLSKNNIFPCHLCDKSFKTKSDVNRHRFYIHEDRKKIIPCPKCPKKWKSEKTLKRHMMSHNTNFFKCPFEGCTVVRKLQYSLNHHFKSSHGKINHKSSLIDRLEKEKRELETTPCEVCGTQIKAGKCPRYNMSLHMKIHDKDAPLDCPLENCSEKIYYIASRNLLLLIIHLINRSQFIFSYQLRIVTNIFWQNNW